MGKEIPNEYGIIDIAEEVIATIAGVAAIECYGLVGMAPRKFADGIGELVGRDSLSKGIEVKIENNEVQIDIYIVVSYGTRISEVALNVMNKVRYAVENMTGLKVVKVNVNVQGVKVASVK